LLSLHFHLLHPLLPFLNNLCLSLPLRLPLGPPRPPDLNTLHPQAFLRLGHLPRGRPDDQELYA
jgi:hypothetical protein